MMKKQTVLFFFVALTSFVSAASLKEIEELRLFDADFSAMWQAVTADAQFAKGSPKVRVLDGAARPLFDADPTETICHGILVGKECPALRYETAGNLATASGSIELVFASKEWEATDPGTYMFVQCGAPKFPQLYIYKSGDNGVGTYIGNMEPKWSYFPRLVPAKYPGKGRHHLVLTYSPDEIRLYFDGKFVSGKKPAGAISPWAKYMDIGPSGRLGKDARTTIARLTTYSRPLQGEEIRLLASARLPHLKLEANAAVDKVVIPPSILLRQTERLGLEALEPNWVPSPFLPVEREGARFRVWNREYDFSGTALLKQIISGGEPILESPVELAGNIGNSPFALALGPIGTLSVDAKGRKVFVRPITGPAGVSGSVTTTIEYDGTVRFDFKATGLERVQNLSLRVPMKKAFSDTAHYTGTMGRTLRTIVGPDVSYSHLLPMEKTGTLLERPFCTHVWLGGTRGGVMLIHDSDKAFWPKEIEATSPDKWVRETYFSWERATANGPAVLGARYVKEGANIPAGGLAEFSAGLIATPVRPMPKGWRAWSMSAQYDRLQGHKRGNLLVYWPDGWKARISLDPDPERARDKVHPVEVVNEDHAQGRKVMPYWNHRNVGVRSNHVYSPDQEYLEANFSPSPHRSDAGGPRHYVRVTSASGYTDYLMRCIAAWGRVFGPVDGTYIDEMENVCDDSPKTNGGYVAPDGTRRLTYSVWADRDMYKRMDAVVRLQNKGETPYSIAHCSGMLMMELLSHFAVMLTGEHLFSGYFPHRKDLLPPEGDRLYYYSYSLPMDRVRTEFYHRPWGIVMFFLPCLKNQRDIMGLPEPTRDLMSRLMHADILYWPLWCNADELYKMEAWRREFDIGNDAVVFIPYWENKEITSKNRNACISYYQKNNDYLVILSNLARCQETITVQLPKGAKAAFNAETKATINVANGTLTVTIPRNDFCPIRFSVAK